MSNLKNYIVMLVILTPIISFAQLETWIYTYNGNAFANTGEMDMCNALTLGTDMNLYAAGFSTGIRTGADFLVISLDNIGNVNWLYKFPGSGNQSEIANSTVYGSDNRIYTTGFTSRNSSSAITIICLDTDGTERWVYTCDDFSSAEGTSITYGSDGNIYVTGYVMTSTQYDFAIISVDRRGAERWVYTYDGPASGTDKGLSVVYGNDDNLYAVGYSKDTDDDFTIISLDTNGTERWVYRYNGSMSGSDMGLSVFYGTDGNLYAAGYSMETGTYMDFTIISLDTNGTERWVYTYDGNANGMDLAYSVVHGSDGNVYAAGRGMSNGTGFDYTIISLDTEGTERWVYTYDGPASGTEVAYSVTYDISGNDVIAGGYSETIDNGTDYTIINLDISGAVNWIETYNGPANGMDAVGSIVYGSGGHVYAAGASEGIDSNLDFMVTGIGMYSPVIDSTTTYDNTSGTGPFPIFTTVTDMSTINEVILYYKRTKDSDWIPVKMVKIKDDQYYAEIPSAHLINYTIKYYIYSEDMFQNQSTDPDGAPANHYSFVAGCTGIADFEQKPRGFSFGLKNNPIKEKALFSLELPSNGLINLRIYDSSGRLINQPLAQEKPAGVYEISWKPDVAGIYFYKFSSSWQEKSGKLVVLK